MSDGPHRSLPMRRGWKKVAEWADNANFGSEQVAERMTAALLADFNRDAPAPVIDRLRKEFEIRDADLFPELREQSLADFEQQLAGAPLRQLLLECAEHEIRTGNLGASGLRTAIEAAVAECMHRATRQVEEHYHRHPRSSKERAVSVRERMEEAAQRVPRAQLIGRILGVQSGRPPRTSERRGLDDGVPRR